jgi:hypothetical protein
MKFAVKLEELKKLDNPYYLVKWTQTTVSNWMIIGDETGYYREVEYVVLCGEIPDIVRNYDIAIGGNIYICYGEYVGEIETPAIEETISEYQLSGWDILYPIKREAIFPFWPKAYLTHMDMNRRR